MCGNPMAFHHHWWHHIVGQVDREAQPRFVADGIDMSQSLPLPAVGRTAATEVAMTSAGITDDHHTYSLTASAEGRVEHQKLNQTLP